MLVRLSVRADSFARVSGAEVKIANIEETRSGEFAVGHINGQWRDLGRAIGTRGVGLRRIEVTPAHFSTPAHEHGLDEEIFFVLNGEGLLWQDGATYAVRACDCIVHRPKRGVHTLRAGDGGLDVLVFGQRADVGLTALPRAGVAWSFPRWVGLAEGESPFALEAAAGAPECPEPQEQRPANVVALEEVEAILEGRCRRLGMAAGSSATGLNHVVLAPGASGAPAHCHSMEEEVFLVLDGSAVLELYARGETSPQEHALGRGDVVACLPGTGVAHTLRAGDDGVTYLAYGTREPSDLCFYPQSGRVSLRGLGIALRSPEIDVLPEL
jgi:uncharacterized cupin superfamily protein